MVRLDVSFTNRAAAQPTCSRHFSPADLLIFSHSRMINSKLLAFTACHNLRCGPSFSEFRGHKKNCILKNSHERLANDGSPSLLCSFLLQLVRCSNFPHMKRIFLLSRFGCFSFPRQATEKYHPFEPSCIVPLTVLLFSVVNHLNLNFEQTKADATWKCRGCFDSCCCCHSECKIKHRHCFTYNRTKKRYEKARKWKMQQQASSGASPAASSGPSKMLSRAQSEYVDTVPKAGGEDPEHVAHAALLVRGA